MTKLCIVCGKPIPKRTTTIYFKKTFETYSVPKSSWQGGGFDTFEGKSNGTRETTSYGTIDLWLDTPPTNKAEAQRHVNMPIVSISYGGPPYVYSATFWDGESYRSDYFHADICAVKQGVASAQHGHRYTWSKS